MAGTYAQDNLAAEQNLLQDIFEANAGIRLNKRFGQMRVFLLPISSHIGLESAISKDNALMRVEGRLLTSKDAIYTRNSRYIEKPAMITSSVTITFERPIIQITLVTTLN